MRSDKLPPSSRAKLTALGRIYIQHGGDPYKAERQA